MRKKGFFASHSKSSAALVSLGIHAILLVVAAPELEAVLHTKSIMDNQTLCQQITQTINNVSITNCSKITVNQHINPSARNYNLKEKSAWKAEVFLVR